MASFSLFSELRKARLKVRRKTGDETIHAIRPFYKDVLDVDWGPTHYTIVRSGLVIRGAKVYRENEYIGKVEEKIGFMTHFDVYHKAKKSFEIKERETLFKQHFEIVKDGKQVGVIRPEGVYIPILSNLGKGIEGEYTGITKDDEEMLLMAVLALGV
ncbi:MAG: hypothetical protein KAW41_01925 [Candidatus Diapherotrites archaeon]|nr:hypothetical protein [Candidatus Diapherotrites archaeon]